MGLRKYTSEVVREGKRVRWPKKDQFWPALAVVVVIAAIAAILLMLEDYAAGSLIQSVKQVFEGILG